MGVAYYPRTFSERFHRRKAVASLKQQDREAEGEGPVARADADGFHRREAVAPGTRQLAGPECVEPAAAPAMPTWCNAFISTDTASLPVPVVKMIE